MIALVVFLQAEDGIRDLVRSRGLGDVYKRQASVRANWAPRPPEAPVMKATRPERSMLYAIEGTSTKNEENDRSIVPVNGIKSVAQPTDTCTCCGARYRPCSTETSHDKPGNTGPVRPARSNGIRRGRGPVSYTHLTLPTSDLV